MLLPDQRAVKRYFQNLQKFFVYHPYITLILPKTNGAFMIFVLTFDLRDSDPKQFL